MLKFMQSRRDQRIHQRRIRQALPMQEGSHEVSKPGNDPDTKYQPKE